MDAELERRGVLRNAPLARGSVVELGLALDASQVIYGEYSVAAAAAGEAPRITLRVRSVDLKAGRRGFEWSEAAPLAGFPELLARLCWRVQGELGVAQPWEDFARANPPLALAALENYARGLRAASLAEQHRLIAAAVRLEPGFSRAAYRLGVLQFQRKDYSAAAGWFERVSPAGARYRDGQFRLGLCLYHLGRFPAAQQAFARVAAVVPLGEVYNNLGAAQLHTGGAGAAENFRQAIDSDHADPAYHFNLGYALWRAGRFEQAADSFRAALDRDPGDQLATLLLGRALQRSGPRRGETRLDNLERLKWNFDEHAWRQLRALIGPARR